MSSFEFIFSLFGLVLGLTLTELLGGFAKAVKRHGPAKLGIVAPVLVLFMTYEVTDFWLNAWAAREVIPVRMATLLVCVAITGLYYFAAVLVWPEDGDAGWEDLDGWILSHKRSILLSIFGSNILAATANWAISEGGDAMSPPLIALIVAYFAAILAAAFAPGRRTTLAALGLLLAMHLSALVVDLL